MHDEAIEAWFVRRVIGSLNLVLQLMAVVLLVHLRPALLRGGSCVGQALGQRVWRQDLLPLLLAARLLLALGQLDVLVVAVRGRRRRLQSRRHSRRRWFAYTCRVSTATGCAGGTGLASRLGVHRVKGVVRCG